MDDRKLITLAEAAKYLPGRSMKNRPHIKTMYRWSYKGCRGVRLRTVKIGWTRATCKAWIDEFIQAFATVPKSTPKQRRHLATKFLKRAGLR